MRTKEEWKNRLQGIQRAFAAGDPEPLDIVCDELANLEEMANKPPQMIQVPTPVQPAKIEAVPPLQLQTSAPEAKAEVKGA